LRPSMTSERLTAEDFMVGPRAKMEPRFIGASGNGIPKFRLFVAERDTLHIAKR
jgi:hypothetical protein